LTIPSIATYVPIYGRECETDDFILNLVSAYGRFAILNIFIIDCKGTYCAAEISIIAKEYNCSVQLIHASQSDYWGACINISLRHFIASKDQYFLICNNDSYHFPELAEGMIGNLVRNGSALCAIGNVEYFDREEIYRSSPALGCALSKYVKCISHGVRFDSRSLSFIPVYDGRNPNVAPTVSIAISRKFIMAAGSSLFVPNSIPHYLSDYYFTHELHKHGVFLLPDHGWLVLRFKNEPSAVPNNSPFHIKSHSYIPAWIAFFRRNVSARYRLLVLFWLIHRLLAFSVSSLKSICLRLF